MVRENRNEVLEHIGEKRAFRNNILRRMTNCYWTFSSKKFLLHYIIDGQLTEMNGRKKKIAASLLFEKEKK